MEEADKYKQRLEAIAEKRRLQEEQDRARREMEEEKLRLQQLKRKSLRDQWLMEGAPLSPASPDAQSPRSPLWGSQAQEIERRIDKLQTESERLAEEEEKLKEQMGDGQTEAVKAGEASAEIACTVVQNGENKGLETTEDDMKTNQSPLVDETAAVLTNGAADPNPHTSEQSNQSTTNGPVVASEGVISMKSEPGLSLGVSEPEPGHVPNVNSNEQEEEEEEEGTLVIRAECVMITDEGDDVPEDLGSQENQCNHVEPEETPPQDAGAGLQGGEAVVVEELMETEAPPTQPDESKAEEPSAEAEPAAADRNLQGDVEPEKSADSETKAEDPTSVEEQPPANGGEDTALPSVPVYSLSTPTSEREAEAAASPSPVGAEAEPAQHPATLPNQFQEVPLADPQENQRREAEPEEQEPLLTQTKAHNTHTEAAAVTAGTETQIPPRARQGEETPAPKRKTCQCCSVM